MSYNPRMSPFYKWGFKDMVFHPVIIILGILVIGKIYFFGMPNPSKYENK